MAKEASAPLAEKKDFSIDLVSSKLRVNIPRSEMDRTTRRGTMRGSRNLKAAWATCDEVSQIVV